MSNEELKKVIQEVVGNNDPFWNDTVFDIVKKIIESPIETNLTIADLINYNPEKEIINPMVQGQIRNLVIDVCKKINIKLQTNREDFGGLAYYYSFKKMEDKKENISFSDDEIKSIIIKQLGHDDPYWVNPILNIVLKIVKMEDGTKSSVLTLLGDNGKEYTSKQLFDIDEVVNKVCSDLKIELDKSQHKGQFLGLPFNIPFVKRKK